MTTQKTKHAIVIRFSSLGDIVLCSAFVQALARRSDIGKISFVTLQSFEKILSRFPNKMEAISAPKQSIFANFKWGHQIAKELLGEEFIFFDLHSNIKSFAFIAGFKFGSLTQQRASIEVLKTPRKTFARILSTLLRRDLLKKRLIFEEHQSLLGISTLAHPKLSSSATQKSGILLAPDSQHWKKKLPESLCREIVLEILNKTLKNITIVGAPGILSAAFFAELENAFPNRITNKLGLLPIEELPNIAAAHEFCICGNSAWLHISEAVNTPVLSFAGPIVEGFGFSPWMPSSFELSKKLNCRPCTRHGGGKCNQDGHNYHACMLQIDWRPKLSKILESNL